MGTASPATARRRAAMPPAAPRPRCLRRCPTACARWPRPDARRAPRHRRTHPHLPGQRRPPGHSLRGGCPARPPPARSRRRSPASARSAHHPPRCAARLECGSARVSAASRSRTPPPCPAPIAARMPVPTTTGGAPRRGHRSSARPPAMRQAGCPAGSARRHHARSARRCPASAMLPSIPPAAARSSAVSGP
jgi:hypothetical protein